MTAGKLAIVLELRIAPQGPCYVPHPGRVTIPPEILHRDDASSLLIVAHEYAHAEQHIKWPLLFALRWFTPVTWWLEWHAWQRALATIHPMVTDAQYRQCRAQAARWGWTYS